MLFTLWAALSAAVAYAVFSYFAAWRRNVLIARKTGLKYFVVHASPIGLWWQLGIKIWSPMIKILPKWIWEYRLLVMTPDWAYSTGQKVFEYLGTDTFLTVSPYDILMYTQDAEVIHRITQRREAFPKDIDKYSLLSMFGHNVLTTEAQTWRLHRKVTSASFNEKNAAHTFSEAIYQTRGMLDELFGAGGETKGTTKTITTLEHDTMTWALNVIGYVGFGLRLLWPNQKMPEDTDPKLVKYGSLDPPDGHSITFAKSVERTLDKIITILVFPDFLLKHLPFKFASYTYEAKANYLQYMDEFLRDKAKEAQAGESTKEGMDIMGQLVQSKYGLSPSEKAKQAGLDDAEIVGNAFIMIVAGHETTANTLHFAIAELAINPATQRRLQKDVDSLFGDSDPSTWDYEKNINAMTASHIGACINETLRLMPPVTLIPKVVSASSDQTITAQGKTHVLPSGLSCNLMAVSVQRNPRFWPTKSSEKTGAPTDLDDFLPDRWYQTQNTGTDDEKDEEGDGVDYGGFQGSDTSASFYRPVRGSYIPFSDGPRSCLGRRIAMVEMNAVLAVIFQKYSVELAVDEWASDGEVENMDAAARRELYKKAQAKAQKTLNKATSVLTLKLHGGKHVPVRIVKRGKERFVNDVKLS